MADVIQVNIPLPVSSSKGKLEKAELEKAEVERVQFVDLLNALEANITEPPLSYESSNWNTITDDEKNKRLDQRRKDEVKRVLKIDTKSPIAVLAIPLSDKFMGRVEFLKKILDSTVNKNDGAEKTLESKCISLCIA